jgi:hypothetical protein
MSTRSDFHKVVIGRSEFLYFTTHGKMPVPAKIDTGAYRSAVHADKIVEKDGELSFRLLGNHPVGKAFAAEITTKSYKQVTVANSFGHEEVRYEVKLPVKLGPKLFTAEFTLANRSKKVYPILIGRKLLNRRFVVDTAASSINRVKLKKEYNLDFPKDEEEGRA